MTPRVRVACMMFLFVSALSPAPAAPAAAAGGPRVAPARGVAVVAASGGNAGAPGARGPRAATAPANRPRGFAREAPFVERAFRPWIGDRWIGEAVAYGPYRDGQRPGGPAPSRAELREDLGLMLEHWNLLRVYGAVGPTDSLLQIIHREGLPMKVLLGAWIAREERRDSTGRVLERDPEARAANRREIEAAVRLAAAYPEIVLAVSVGNETQVFWSPFTIPPALLIGYLREVRARTAVPVTTSDDFAFWRAPESRAIADEVDFLLVHLHPLWNGRPLDDAVPWARRTLAEVQAAHPGRRVVIGETGWGTKRTGEGDQGRLIKGQTGEAEQAAYCKALTAWTRADSIPTFLFEAFDENWKGGSDPDDVEKHWGLYRADRTPKPALRSAD